MPIVGHYREREPPHRDVVVRLVEGGFAFFTWWGEKTARDDRVEVAMFESAFERVYSNGHNPKKDEEWFDVYGGVDRTKEKS